MGALHTVAIAFKKYLIETTKESNFSETFAPYLDHMKMATLAINGIMAIRSIYGELVDGTAARRQWVHKHPEWTEG